MPIGLGIGLNISMRGGLASGFSLAALTLAWSTSATDNTPGFSVSGDSLDVAPVDAQIELQVADDVNFTPPPSDTELSAVTGNPVTIDVSPALSDGQYWARARLLDSGDTPLTDWSNVVTETIATVVPFSFEDAGITGNNTSGTSATYTGKAIGTAATGRVLQIDVIAHAPGDSPDISGLTVNGNAATLNGTVAKNSTLASASFYYAIDTGTTADIVVSWNGITVPRSALSVRAIYGSSGTPTDSYSSVATSGNSVTVSIDVPTGGVACGFEYHGNADATTWSGTDTVEHTASTAIDTIRRASSAYNDVAGAPKSLTATWSTSGHNAAAGSAWGP